MAISFITKDTHNLLTQAFTENNTVCLSQRIAVGVEPKLGGVVVPDPVVLELEPGQWKKKYQGKYKYYVCCKIIAHTSLL